MLDATAETLTDKPAFEHLTNDNRWINVLDELHRGKRRNAEGRDLGHLESRTPFAPESSQNFLARVIVRPFIRKPRIKNVRHAPHKEPPRTSFLATSDAVHGPMRCFFPARTRFALRRLNSRHAYVFRPYALPFRRITCEVPYERCK